MSLFRRLAAKGVFAFMMFAWTTCLTRAAIAQSLGRAINHFEPSEPGSDWFTTESLDLRGHLRPSAGVVTDWAYRPLELNHPNTNGTSSTPPPPPSRFLVDQIVVHSRASLVFADAFRASVSVPVVIYQHGDDPLMSVAGAHAPRRAQALGDLRLGLDARLLGTYASLVRAALGLQVFLPTGSRDLYTGDETLRVAPRLLFAGAVSVFDWAAKVGFMFRSYRSTWEDYTFGHETFLALSAGVKVNDRFVLGPELQGATTVSGPDALHSRATPIEILMGARVKLANDFQMGSAIGGRVTPGDGAAVMRVLALFEWAPDICVDKDGDGICAADDACPELDGVRTNDRRTNGCPSPKIDEEPPTKSNTTNDKPPEDNPEEKKDKEKEKEKEEREKNEKPGSTGDPEPR